MLRCKLPLKLLIEDDLPHITSEILSGGDVWIAIASSDRYPGCCKECFDPLFCHVDVVICFFN